MRLVLSDIANGEMVVVSDLDVSPLQVKLMEMGIIRGKKIKVLFRAPLGDPMAIDVDGYILSLRKDEAELVMVERTKA